MKLISNQIITDYSEVNTFFPVNITEDYMFLKSDVRNTIDAINNLSPLFGDGSPEGVVKSNLNRTYFDKSGATVIMYVNESINSKTGWKQVNV